MTKTIIQKIIFKNQKASVLYSMFLDSKHHKQLTGGNDAKMSLKEGAKFSAHGGYCFGKNLQLLKNKLIVQSWRGSDWGKDELDSTFILSFDQIKNDALLTMVHANVPDAESKSIADGWKEFYWKPWKEYLKTVK